VHLFGRSVEKAKRLLEEFELDGKAWTLGERPEIRCAVRLINASPLGMFGYPPMPEPMLALVDGSSRDAVVLDMVYDPVETALLARARARNLMTANGLAMLVDQAREAFELFFGAKPGSELDQQLFERLTS
jgi:shikimate dehydrogenase